MGPISYQVICGLLFVGFFEFIGAISNSKKGHHNRIPQVSYACDGFSVTLKCPNNEVIKVLGADYGRWTRTVCNSEPIQNMNCHSDRLKTIKYVQGVCENKNNCQIGAGNGYDDPCLNTFKHLEIIYTCIAVYLEPTPKNELWKAVHGCDGDINNLECPNGKLINIHVADDGRWNRIICNREPIKTLSCYADSQISLDFHKKSCDNKKNCSLESSGGPQPDPCYGTLKFSEIIYSCDEPPPKPAVPQVSYACDGSTVTLKCPNNEVIKVLGADYGRWTRTVCNSEPIHNMNCHSDPLKTMQYVQGVCENKNNCQIGAGNGYDDPCFNTFKHLEIIYTCNAVYLEPTPKNELWKAVHGCDGDINNLECPNGRLINIHVADDGRWNRIICNREPIKTLSCHADSQISLDFHKKRCDKKTTCSLESSGGPQPDPCYGTLKFSEIIYTCDVLNPQSSLDLPVNQQCMGCICEAASGCNTTELCQGDVCGPFRITRAYWVDAGKPTMAKEQPDSKTAFSNCASDVYCSSKIVQNYMSNFKQDCTEDGKIDCLDFVLIHKYGGYECKNGRSILDPYAERFNTCQHYVDMALNMKMN